MTTVAQDRQPLSAGWQMLCTEAGVATTPDEVLALTQTWYAATVPSTVASTLEPLGLCSFEKPLPLDELDSWWRCEFAVEAASTHQRLSLELQGLATLAEVWLNGTALLSSNNMFHSHQLDVTTLLGTKNQLHIRFAALGPVLRQRRPRGRWRTKLVAQQALRWVRSSLLGRIPGWSPPLPALGPWRPINLLREQGFAVQQQRLQARLEGSTGVLSFRLQALALGVAPDCVRLTAGIHSIELSRVQQADGSWLLEGELHIADVDLWWPHSHGEPTLYEAGLHWQAAGHSWQLALGKVGFRSVVLNQADNGFALELNGIRLFCRGACWTTADFLRLTADAQTTRNALLQVKAAGMNMLRVGGTMFYEASHFYESCDELGILIWQEWMFANMDYPAEDAEFVESVEREARDFLQRTQASPCLALLCGNSEVEQQAAMLGIQREHWSNRLFQTVLPAIGREQRPDLPYWCSSPSGGFLPFQVDAGASHYFGVGAYMQPLSDARRSGVRFTSECLAFANVPEPETVEALLADGESAFHHAKWKARVPRDSGPGWDFDDVRDHYLGELFRVDPMRLRYTDIDRYLALSRVVSGEVMAASFAEWRRPESTCHGALIWFYRDLWPGAGWGLVDANGLPKAAWYYLKRALAPVALLLTDEGLNGLALHVINDQPVPLNVRLQLSLYRDGETLVAQGEMPISLAAHSSCTQTSHALLGQFLDVTYRYRFGPPGLELAVASLLHAETGERCSEACYFPLGLPNTQERDLGLKAEWIADLQAVSALIISSQRFAQAVVVEAPGYTLSDNYFHLAPRGIKQIALTPVLGARQGRISVTALNASGRVQATTQP